jgi:hypothetical protein
VLAACASCAARDGPRVGNPNAVAKIKEKAARRATDLQGIIEGIKRSGVSSVRAITDELNRQGISAPRGGVWHPTAVTRLLNRLPRNAWALRLSRFKHSFARPPGEGKISAWGPLFSFVLLLDLFLAKHGREERYLIVACTVITDVPEAIGPWPVALMAKVSLPLYVGFALYS